MTNWKPWANTRQVYDEYPRPFWTLMGASFIDALGGALLFPFFTLYVTAKFGLGLSQVGLIFALLTLTNIVGSTIGGGLADRFGRKSMVIFGLISSALTVLALGLVDEVGLFIAIVLVTGMTGNIGGPARQAMVADLLPEEKRAGGFGLHRVIHNLAYVVGPAVGGLLAAKSYLLLFIIDTSASLVTALLIYLFLAETRPPSESSEPQVSTVETFKNYRHVFADRFFIFFMLATALMVLVYTQMQGPLAVFLRDYHGLPEQGFGYILSLNAGMVVLMQFWITRKIEHLPPFLVLAAGTLFYVVGFGMYGIVAAYPLFLLAMAIITLGEMLTAPVGSAVAAQLAPESMRGRYMAVYGFSWMVPGAVGMYLAGLIFDNYDPRLVWYASALVGVIAALAFLGLHLSRTKRLEPLLEAVAAGIDG